MLELNQSPVQVAVATLSIANTARSDFSGNSAAALALKSAIRDQINSVYVQGGSQSFITVNDINILGFDESTLRVRRLVRALVMIVLCRFSQILTVVIHPVAAAIRQHVSQCTLCCERSDGLDPWLAGSITEVCMLFQFGPTHQMHAHAPCPCHDAAVRSRRIWAPEFKLHLRQ